MGTGKQDHEGVWVLEKGDKFTIDKEITKIHVGTFWEPSRSGPRHDVDAHAILLVHRGGNADNSVMYNGGSHFLTYANRTLDRIPEGGDEEPGFKTQDGTMWHSVDNRRGGDGGLEHDAGSGHEDEELSEEMEVDLANLPHLGMEISVWLTIHEAAKHAIDFGDIEGLFVEICDASAGGAELCRYHPKGEFAGFTALQVGSLMRQSDDSWQFVPIGAASQSGLGDIIAAYGG